MEVQSQRTRPTADAGGNPVIPFRGPMEEKPTLLQVFEAEESPLLRFAYGLVSQRETAEDLVQEAFVKLHSHWEEVVNPRAWLFRAVRNLSLNHIRDHRRETSLDTEHEHASDTPNPEQNVGRLEAVGTLQLLISELDPQDRMLVTLKYHDNLKYDQISERTGLSVSNVGYKLHHALKNLAASLRRLGVETAED